MEYEFLAYPNGTFDLQSVTKYVSRDQILYIPGVSYKFKDSLNHRIATLADNLSSIYFNGQLSKHYGDGVVIYVIPGFPLEFLALETGVVPDHFSIHEKDVDDLLSWTRELNYVTKITHYLSDANDYCCAYDDEILNSGLTKSIGFSTILNNCPVLAQKGGVAIEHLSKKIKKKFIFS